MPRASSHPGDKDSLEPTVTLGVESLAALRIPGDDLRFTEGELLDGRFRIVREVGRGGMGVVYEATDEKLGRRIALKCARARYGKYLTPEVRNASEVSHPNICRIFEIHTTPTRFGDIDFITMEFLEGETLSRRLERSPVPESEARIIARQLAAGLAEAHRMSVIHGDIKSSNVILTTAADDSVRAVITDFGLARDAGARAAGAGGTPGYMAPELWRGEANSARSDIYALGAVLFELVCGHAPWQQKSAIAESRPLDWAAIASRKPPSVNARWDRILARCLDPDPARRYQNAHQIVLTLAPSRTLRRVMAAAIALTLAAATGAVTYRKATAPPDTVKLAVLPFSVLGAPVPSAAGMGEDLASRLAGVRRQFSVLSPSDMRRGGAASPESARALGATHALQVQMRASGAAIHMSAALIDLSSGQQIRALDGDYSARDASLMARALLGTVTGAFNLKRGAPKEVVSAAAYPLYVQGKEILRTDNTQPDAAIPLLEKAVALDSQSALPLAALAVAEADKFLAGGGQQWLDRAQESVARALRMNPDAVPVLLAAGFVEEQRGSYEAAVHEFTRAVELDPLNPEAWRHLAFAFDKSNRTVEAASAYRKAIGVDPGYYPTYIDFGNFYLFRGDFPEAEKNYRHVVSTAPLLPVGHMNLGLALMQQGKFAEAETSLRTSLRLRSTPEALVNLGAVYYAEGRFAEAAGSFEESLRAGDASSLQYKDLGDAWRQLGRKVPARIAYRKALSLAENDVSVNPRDAFARALLGSIAARTGSAARAASELSQALAMEPENVAVLRESVIAFEATGNRTKALGLLQTAPPRLIRELSRNPDLTELRRDRRFVELLHALESK